MLDVFRSILEELKCILLCWRWSDVSCYDDKFHLCLSHLEGQKGQLAPAVFSVLDICTYMRMLNKHALVCANTILCEIQWTRRTGICMYSNWLVFYYLYLLQHHHLQVSHGNFTDGDTGDIHRYLLLISDIVCTVGVMHRV